MSLQQAEELYDGVMKAIEATSGGEALVERVKQSTADLSREREEQAWNEVKDARAAADDAETGFDQLCETVRQLDLQAAEEIEEGQKIVDSWALRIDELVVAWRKHMIEGLQWQEGYAEMQIEKLRENMDNPPEKLDDYGRALVDAYKAGRECEKTFATLSAEWETKLAAAHENEALEKQKVFEAKKQYEIIYRRYRSR